MRRALFSTFLVASDVLAASTDCDNLQAALSGLQCEEKRTCSEGFTCNIHRKLHKNVNFKLNFAKNV